MNSPVVPAPVIPDYRCYDCNAEWSTWGKLRFCPACKSPEVIKVLSATGGKV